MTRMTDSSGTLPAPASTVMGAASARLWDKYVPDTAERVLVLDSSPQPRGNDGRLGPAVPGGYHAIVLDGVLSRFADLSALFQEARALLSADGSRLILVDGVQDSREWRRSVGGHRTRDLERELFAAGFFVYANDRTDAVRPPILRDVVWHRSGAAPGAPSGPEPVADAAETRGQEVWDLRPVPLRMLPYRTGDETAIIATFEEVFGASRTMDHWRWKFAESPFGPTRCTNAWEGDRLVAHYSGYGVPFWMNGETHPALHIGDTMIQVSHRGMGRGKRSLFAQMFRQFGNECACGQVTFGYGFSTGTALKLGRMFLGYDSPALVFVRTLEGEALRALAAEPRSAAWRQGFTVSRTRKVGAWADVVFRRARQSLGWQVARTSEYLRWRYEKHPDYEHEFFVVSQWGVPCGWWLGRVNGDTFELGDAMFRSRSRGAARAGMAALLRAYRRDRVELRKVTGWMSMVPDWWNRQLDAIGFARVQEENGIELIVKPCVSDLDSADFARNFYFTQGDSDMY